MTKEYIRIIILAFMMLVIVGGPYNLYLHHNVCETKSSQDWMTLGDKEYFNCAVPEPNPFFPVYLPILILTLIFTEFLFLDDIGGLHSDGFWDSKLASLFIGFVASIGLVGCGNLMIREHHKLAQTTPFLAIIFSIALFFGINYLIWKYKLKK